MNDHEKRAFLIRRLQGEMPMYKKLPVPDGGDEQWQMLRSLMNVRPPMPAKADFLEVQDEYLQEETAKKGIVDVADIESALGDEKLAIWRGDITRLKADAIVNAGNGALLGCFRPCHFCIDNIIHTFAGVQLRLACNEIMEAQGHEEVPGGAKITEAFNLPCRYVIHTVGPIIQGALRDQDCDTLASCYRSCLELASAKGLHSIVFCCISTGVFAFPQRKAAEIAVSTVKEWLDVHKGASIEKVIFDVFKEEDDEIYRELTR
jgi:Predicted phosphatase homologous to the C-terminal domain of histone macroH2A1